MTLISNCCSSGGDSRANPVTGVVTRKDPTTGQDVPASVRGNGLPSGNPSQAVPAVNGVSLSSAVLGVLLAGQK